MPHKAAPKVTEDLSLEECFYHQVTLIVFSFSKSRIAYSLQKEIITRELMGIFPKYSTASICAVYLLSCA